MRVDIKILEENIDATQRQLSKLYISQQNISMLTKKVEQLQKQKGDLVKTMEKMARNNTFLSKENRRLKSKGVFLKFTKVMLKLHPQQILKNFFKTKS